MDFTGHETNFAGTDLAGNSIGGGSSVDLSAVSEDIIPATTDTYDIGSTSNYFKSAYFNALEITNTINASTFTTLNQINISNNLLFGTNSNFEEDSGDLLYKRLGASKVKFTSSAFLPQGSYDLGASGFEWRNIYCTNLIEVSDRNAKESIEDCSLGLDFINRLKPVEYKYKNEVVEGTAKVRTGFIAQDVEDLVKDIGVDWAGVRRESYEDEEKVMREKLYLQYTCFIAPLVKSVNELWQKHRDNQIIIDRILAL